MAGTWTRIEDIFPIQHVFFFHCYVSLPNGKSYNPPKKMQVECSHGRDVGVPQTDSQNPLNKIAGPGR